MQVFISSVILGMEEYRDAAADGIRSLGPIGLRADDYGASPGSPQQVCLEGVRKAEVVILLLGARYGAEQPSGLSATHEEYREAKDRCDVLVFIQAGTQREPDQDRFIRETQDWEAGRYTESFSTPAGLRDSVTRAVHRLELSRSTGFPDQDEMLARAESLTPTEEAGRDVQVSLIVVGGPRQSILRPSQLEDEGLRKILQREANYGDLAVFNPAEGTAASLEGDALILRQPNATLLVNELGAVRLTRPIHVEQRRSLLLGGMPILIEEEVHACIQGGLAFLGWTLDQIDKQRRLADVAIVAALINAWHVPWKTRAEHEREPNRFPMGKASGTVTVHLSPPSRKRAALAVEGGQLAADLTVLLRREVHS